MNLVINLVAFKLGWIASVVGAASDIPLVGPLVVLLALSVHLFLSASPSRELALVMLAGAIGFCADSVLVSAGWLTFTSGTFAAGFAPYWIMGMWMLFATTLNVAFRWLHDKMLLAALLGAISGPASYYAGEKLGAVTLSDTTTSLIALSVSWAVILPALVSLAKQLDGSQLQVLESRV